MKNLDEKNDLPVLFAEDNTGIVKSVALTYLCTLPPEMQRRQKLVDPVLIEKAFANNPLDKIPNWEIEPDRVAQFFEVFPMFQEGFYKEHFLQLFDLGVTLDKSDEEISMILGNKISEDPSLEKHLNLLKDSFISMRYVFRLSTKIMELNRFSGKNLTALHSIAIAFNSISGINNKSDFIKPIGLVCKHNLERYIWEIPLVIPARNLPEILVAMPVWFLGKDKLRDTTTNDDPEPDEALQLICDFVGSWEFAQFYQLYNRRTRLIENYIGKDPIPLSYKEIMPITKPYYDLEIIATPYHSIASKEWADPNWIAGIDPIAIGLKKNIPYLTMLKRWSGNGIFPGFGELIGDTISNIKKNLNLISHFPTNAYWYKGTNQKNSTWLGSHLPKFAQNCLTAFEQGKLFDYLRGELELPIR